MTLTPLRGWGGLVEDPRFTPSYSLQPEIWALNPQEVATPRRRLLA